MGVFGYIFLASERGQLVPEGEQKAGLQEYAQSLDLAIGEFFNDENVSIAVSFDERRGGGQLLQTVLPGDAIIVMRAAWVMAGLPAVSRLIQFLKEKSVSLICVDLKTDIILAEKRRLVISEGGSRLVQQLLSALVLCEEVGKEDKGKCSSRPQRGGEKYRGGPVPFGWEVDKKCCLVQNMKQQEMIGLILAMREDSHSYGDISQKLKDDFDTDFSRERIKRIFNANRKMAGNEAADRIPERGP